MLRATSTRRVRGPRRGPRASAIALAAVVALGSVVVFATPADAHTGFESSDPPDGATAQEPVSRITLRFTGPAEPTGAGFEVLDPSGAVRRPDDVTSSDRSTWVLSFDEPLAGGTVGVRWSVQAPDAHPIDGAFSFVTPVEASGHGAATTTVPGGVEERLDDFVSADAAPSTSTGERIAALGRIVGIGATLLAIGAMVFATFVLRAGPGDLRLVLFWVRRAALVIVLGATIRLIGRVLVDRADDWSAVVDPLAFVDTLGSNVGIAIVLRMLGGVLLAAGCRVRLTRVADVDIRRTVRWPATVGGPPVSTGGDGGETNRSRAHRTVRWNPGTGAVACAAGVAALLAGYLFDGHTVSSGARFVTAMTDVVHVAAAAVWVGGLAMMTSVLRRRHRRGDDLDALHLAARFSVAAAASLVAVAVSGLALTVIVLDAPSELWTTSWGQILLAKTAAVAVAATLGGYNHRVLIPAMEAGPGSSSLSERLRRVVSIEAGVLGLVVVVTAFLVGAAS